MNSKIDIVNEQNGNVILAPSLPPPPTFSNVSSYFILQPNENLKAINDINMADNNKIYNKLLELESEIKSIKNMITNLNQPYSYPPAYPYQVQPYPTPVRSNLINPPLRPNQPNFY